MYHSVIFVKCVSRTSILTVVLANINSFAKSLQTKILRAKFDFPEQGGDMRAVLTVFKDIRVTGSIGFTRTRQWRDMENLAPFTMQYTDRFYVSL